MTDQAPRPRPGTADPDAHEGLEPEGADQARHAPADDPGAYLGTEPEREAETIPGGVSPADERTSAHDSRPGVKGEPDDASDDGVTSASRSLDSRS